jgi:hypothetical protein
MISLPISVEETYTAGVARLQEILSEPDNVRVARNAMRELLGGPIRLGPPAEANHLLAEFGLHPTALLRSTGFGPSQWNGSGGRIR